MNEHGFTKENLLRSLPISLAGDPSMVALAEAIAGLLVQHRQEIDRLSIYPHIERLDEALLDILAHDFKVDWWDSNYTLEEKRRTLQSSWQVHRVLGTKAAVERAISAIYPNTTVKEWFEYEGEPYHFRLDINVSEDGLDMEKQRRVLERLKYYKNLRSHLDEIGYFMKAAPAQTHTGAVFLGSEQRVSVTLLSTAHWPRASFLRTAGVAVLGQLATNWVALRTPKLSWPKSTVTMKFGVVVLGVYQNIRI